MKTFQKDEVTFSSLIKPANHLTVNRPECIQFDQNRKFI